MNEIVAGIYGMLMDSDNITAALSQHNNRAAIFTGNPPEDAEGIYIVVDAPFANPQDNMFSSKTETTREPSFDIRIYDEKTTSYKNINLVADDCWELMHEGKNILQEKLSNYDIKRMVADGPIEGPDEENHIGRLVSVTINLIERSE